MLVFDHVTKRFGANTAIDDVSLTIRAGVITAVIGPNGAGKSTLVNMAAGSYRATSGRILLDGTELQTLPKYRIARAGLGRTYQNIRLFDGLTVLQNLEVALVPRSLPLLIAGAFWLAPRGSAEPRETSRAVLARLGIAHLADRQAGSLACGQQKLVELARAIVGRPRALLLDEPAAGLNHGLGQVKPRESNAVVKDRLPVFDRAVQFVVRYLVMLTNPLAHLFGLAFATKRAESVKDRLHVEDEPRTTVLLRSRCALRQA